LQLLDLPGREPDDLGQGELQIMTTTDPAVVVAGGVETPFEIHVPAAPVVGPRTADVHPPLPAGAGGVHLDPVVL
jgi:hypothetical protein